MIGKLLPYFSVFFGALLATILLTPIVRELSRALGMVDKPDPRRINTVPIPRGGGLAIVIGLALSYGVFLAVTGRPGIYGVPDVVFLKMSVLAATVALLGFVDDKFSLPPKLKLFGQLVIAFLVWFWAGLGFADLWPSIPPWADCALTVFWITGAINAFNLIDGLDGLASGLSFIAVLGMAGGVFFVGHPAHTLFYFAVAGAVLGFLRYNYHPASVFLGDCGSMFLGFVVSALPLVSHVPNSFLVSIGVPLLAMGVPIFDTSLAILRRLIRRLIAGSPAAGEGRVMTPDRDHLHHRILRAAGLSQRRAAWILYALAAAGVCFGLVAMSLESRAGGLWLAAVAVASVVIFKDATIEIFDAGRLLNRVAHANDVISRRRQAVWSVPFYVFLDLAVLIAAYFFCAVALGLRQDEHTIRSFLPVRVIATFVFLVLFQTYRTVWSRAVTSNYIRLLLACVFGSVAGSVFIYYWPSTVSPHLTTVTFVWAVLTFAALLALRVFRGVFRDLFYALDCARLKGRKDVSRILVYVAGLRYRTFRRELVRTTSANDRMIVGLLDDNAFLKGKYIGGLRICGTINDAPAVINALNVDAVVIACVVTDEWLKVVKRILAPTGVKVTHFTFAETAV